MDLQANIGEDMLKLFTTNLQKAHEKYDPKPFNEEVLPEKIRSYLKSYIRFEYPVPEWLIQQYMHFNFTKVFFKLMLEKNVAHYHVPYDDHEQENAKICSLPIRQEIYGILGLKEPIEEVLCLEDYKEDKQHAYPIHPNMSIFTMDQEPELTRINKLLSVLKCNHDTLASLDKEWYIPIASVCYWFKFSSVILS